MSYTEQIDIREQLEKLLAASPAVIYTCGPAPSFATSFISDNVRRALGYEPNDFCREPNFWSRGIHPEDRERVLAKFVGLNAERPLVIEYRFRHRDGHYIWLRDEIMLRSAAGGNVSGLTGTWFDITERKRFELELAKNERKYSALFHDSNDAIFIHDLDGNILDVNMKVLELFGYDREEILRLTVSGLARQELRVHCHNALDQLRQNGVLYLEKPFQRKNGEEFPAELSASTVKIGNEIVVQAIVRDITERQQAEEQLRRSEARTQALLRAIPDMMFQLDADGTFLDYHGQESGLYLPPEHFLGRTADEVLPPHVAELTRQGIERALRTGTPQTYEYELSFAGNTRHFECRMVPFDKEETVAIIREISERKRMERVQAALFEISEAANASADLRDLLGNIHGILGTLIDTTNFYVALYDEDTGYYSFPYFADENEDTTRFAPHEMRGSLTDYVRRTSQPLFADQQKCAELESRGEARMFGIGSEVWLGAPLKTPERVIGVVAVQSYNDPELYGKNDIELMNFVSGHIATAIQRKKTELALRHSEERYRSVFAAIRDGLLITDRRGNIKFANPALSAMLGLPAAELIGAQLRDFLPDDCCGDFAAVLGQNRMPEACRCELAYERSDGSICELALSASPFPDDTGQPAGLVVILVDVTEERRAGRERRELRDKLATAQRMESLGVLAGGVAHDLNNILGPLVGYPQLILEHLPADSPAREQIATIQNSARRAADVVQDLLTMARRGRYEMEPLRLNEVLTSNLESLALKRALARTPQTELRLELEEDLPLIHGSVSHLSKAVMNLILNAVDAMSEGGTLRVRSRCCYLEQLVGGFDNIIPGRYAIISIADTGMGIPAENLKRIFEPFYSTKRMGQSGSGLGLAVVYGVVKDHNGYVDVISEVGRGSEFLIYLPIADAGQMSDKPLDTAGIWGEGRLLIVDDIEEQRQLAQTLLASVGYQVETVADGREAVEFLKTNAVDVVILDMLMEPDFDGLDTFREILKATPQQKAILVSGHAESARVRQALSLGAASFVRKPFTLQQLGLALREALGTPA
ncbi:MAG: PAS domain S-box protein [bacterium]